MGKASLSCNTILLVERFQEHCQHMLSSTSYADMSDGQNWTWEVRGRRQSILALLKYESLKHDQLMSSCMAFSQAFMVN